MEFKEQSVPTGILLKIRKLQALAERGVGGEATNAKILLSALCEKYGIDESKLDEEETVVRVRNENIGSETVLTFVRQYIWND